MSTKIVTGQNGTPSLPAGGPASAENIGSKDLTNEAIAQGGAGVAGENGRGGFGGLASGVAVTDADAAANVSSTVTATGGAAGYISKYAGYSAVGGGASGYADASNQSMSITNVTASAKLLGGAGGAAAAESMGGGGGVILSPKLPREKFGAFALNGGAGIANASVNATGGAGGSAQFNTGGSGGAVSLNNSVGGRTKGGTLNLAQNATGGAGGSSSGYELTGGGGTGGAGANATSLLAVTDASSLGISLHVAATGGAGGQARNGASPSATGGNGGAGGNANARGAATGIGNVVSTVNATGGASGYNTHLTGAAGTASASASAITTGATQNATASANDIGGAGGEGVFVNMFTFGDGGNGAGADASSAFASSIGGKATASAVAAGGAGGESPFDDGGAGGNASLLNAVSANSATGSITLTQSAIGGAGGSNQAGGYVDGGAGGAAYSSLTTTSSTTGAVSSTVNATGGAGGYGLSLSSGGDATARQNFTGAGNILADVAALGGSGDIHSRAAYGGNASASDIATASGGTGNVTANSTANAGYGLSLYTVASATSIADAVRSTGTATATSTAGYTGTNDYAGSAIANATAITAGGKTAVAEATSHDAISGQAKAVASTSDGIVENLAASAGAPVATNQAGPSDPDRGSAQAEVDGGTAYTPAMGTYDSYALAGGLATYKTLGPKAGAVFHSPATQDFGTGTLGYNADPSGSGPQTYTSSISWDLNQNMLAGDTLDLGMINAVAKGNNFSSLTFKISVQGNTVIDKTFSSPSLAASYFTDNALTLGKLNGGASPFDVIVALSITSTGAITDGYGINFMLGATRQLYPLLIAAPPSAAFAAGQATTIKGVNLSEQNTAPGETFIVKIADNAGLLGATGAGVSGSGTTRLTLTGSLPQVNAELATLADTSLYAGADQITFTATDSLGGAATSKTIAATVDGAVGSAGLITVAGGKTSLNLSFSNGAVQIVEAGGFAHNSVVNARGLQQVLARGLSAGTLVNPGGEQIVQGTAQSSTVYGTQLVEAGGLTTGTTVKSGAVEDVLASGTAQNTTIGTGATLALADNANLTGGVKFFGKKAVLQIAGTVLPTAPIGNFNLNNATGDEIVLAGFTYQSKQETIKLTAGNVLTLDLNGVTRNLNLNPAQNYAENIFSITTNALDQVVIVSGANATPQMAFERPAPDIVPAADLTDLLGDVRPSSTAFGLPGATAMVFSTLLNSPMVEGNGGNLTNPVPHPTSIAAAKPPAHQHIFAQAFKTVLH